MPNAYSTGGLFDPATAAWTPTPMLGAPWLRAAHTAVWTGWQMIVWGWLKSKVDNASAGAVHLVLDVDGYFQ